jgi:glycosyltransferase involved in cell wall biosynthesis
MEEFAGHGHNVYVVSSVEKRFGIGTYLSLYNGINVLRVQTGNITSNTNYIAKGFAILQLQSLFIDAIKQHFEKINFDLIIYSTPPNQYNRIVKYLKNKSNAKTYLLLKDISPQDAIDIGLLSKWNPAYWYFRKKETEIYKQSDHIGCMSPANVKYLLEHNPYLSAEKVEVCANSLKDRGKLGEEERIAIRAKIRKAFSIVDKDLLLINGGNLGISQGLDFFLDILKVYRNSLNIKFLIVGEGTWFSRMEKFVSEGINTNVILHERVSPEDFKEFLIASDVGLIFLDPRHTIPNFPSRLTSYLEVGLPVIACTDEASDVGDVVKEAYCGFKVISGDIAGFKAVIENVEALTDNLIVKSANARSLFEKSYTTEKSYSVIMNHIKQ